MGILTMMLLIRFRRRLSMAMQLSALCLALAASPSHAAGDPIEYSIKAAYLYKFGLFVNWLPGSFRGNNSPFNLCLVGEDPFGTVIDEVVRDQQVEGHTISVQRMPTLNPAAGCHIVFLNGLDEARLNAALDGLRGSNVLTVTDGRAANASCGIINFIVSGNRVRFEVDAEAAQQNNLEVSSKLLSLALNVRSRRQGG